MDELLDQVWLDNTLRSYLIVAIIILVVIIVKKYIAQYIAGLIFHFVKAVWKDVDKKSFISLVAKPLGHFPRHICFNYYVVQITVSHRA